MKAATPTKGQDKGKWSTENNAPTTPVTNEKGSPHNPHLAAFQKAIIDGKKSPTYGGALYSPKSLSIPPPEKPAAPPTSKTGSSRLPERTPNFGGSEPLSAEIQVLKADYAPPIKTCPGLRSMKDYVKPTKEEEDEKRRRRRKERQDATKKAAKKKNKHQKTKELKKNKDGGRKRYQKLSDKQVSSNSDIHQRDNKQYGSPYMGAVQKKVKFDK